MLNQLGNHRQSQCMQHAEQHRRVLVQLVGDLEEPRATFSGGQVPGVPQVQPSGPRIYIHNDHLVGAEGYAQTRNASWNSEQLTQIWIPILATYLPGRAVPLRTRRLDFVSTETVVPARSRARAGPRPFATTLPSQGCPRPKRPVMSTTINQQREFHRQWTQAQPVACSPQWSG